MCTPATTACHGTTRISPFDTSETLHLWLSQSRAVEPAARARGGRNLEVMWLLGRLIPDHKTIADFRKDNGPAIRKVCMGLLTKASVAIDGSKFKAVNNRDRNFPRA